MRDSFLEKDSTTSVQIPLLAELIEGGVPYGTSFLIEYDADSMYYQILESVVHGLVSAGYLVSFFDYTRFPDEIRRDLRAMGSAIEALEASGNFHLYDGYSTTLGLKSKEPFRFDSLKVSDLSLEFLKMTKDEKAIKRDIGFSDNGSVVLRYNEEKAFVAWYATRVIPRIKIHERISFSAFVSGIHSSYFYKSMEDLVDGVIDIGLETAASETYTKIRMRSFKKGRFESSWRRVRFEGPHAALAPEK